MLKNIKKCTVIAPHPDDETLGLGGSLARMSALGIEISILIVSGHLPPLYDVKSFEKTMSEAKEAFKILGVSKFEFLKIPATFLIKEDVSSLYNKISSFINNSKPDIVFLPFPDRHIDHRIIFDGGVVACRPKENGFPKTVLLYETLSETHWNVPGVEPSFNPDFFIDITETINKKIEALSKYVSQIDGNLSRSIEAIRALAKFRGSQNGCDFAEAFKLVRMVI